MRIGIDIQSSRGQITGLGVYTSKLLESLLEEKRNGLTICPLSKSQKADWNTPRRLFWENVELPKLVKRERIELLHVPAFAPPCLKTGRLVVTVHDLIGMLCPNPMGIPSRFYWGRWLPLTLKRADRLIAVSEHSKKDVVQHLRIPEKKITVIYSSGHEGFRPVCDSQRMKKMRAQLGIKEKYFLCVGTLEPRKNLLRVMEAFKRFVKQSSADGKFQLVVVGSKDFAHGRFFHEIASIGLEDIIFTGYVEHEDLNCLYACAQAFIFPSLYEGFGFPALEAMASGTPVLTSDRTSLPEVAGKAALKVNPEDTDAIYEGMKLFATDEKARNEFIRKGFERIKHFSWSKTARETLAVYESLC
jgi:glycosyltransferase involved in cell wall biosynthesis